MPRSISPSQSADTTSPWPPLFPEMYLARPPMSSGRRPVSGVIIRTAVRSDFRITSNRLIATSR